MIGELARRAIPAAAGIALAIAAGAATGQQPVTMTEIGIDNFAFTPANLTVAPGTTITWVNHDGVRLLVVVDPGNRRAWGNGQARRSEGKVVDADRSRSIRLLAGRRTGRDGQRNPRCGGDRPPRQFSDHARLA
jgi:plastocyanin